MTGIASNLALTKTPVTSVDQVLEDPKLKGKVTLLTEMADTMSLVMLANGDDPTKVDDASFDRALKKIQTAVRIDQIRQFTGNDYTGPLAKGDLAVAFSWSGDVVQLTADNPKLAVEPGRERRRHLDGQHVHPDRAATSTPPRRS